MSTLLQQKPTPQSQGYGTVNADDDANHGATSLLTPRDGLADASLFSRIFFSFAYPLFTTGNERQLNMDDMWGLEGENRSKAAFEAYNKHFVKHNKSVTRAMVSAYGGSFLLCGLGALFAAGCAVLGPRPSILILDECCLIGDAVPVRSIAFSRELPLILDLDDEHTRKKLLVQLQLALFLFKRPRYYHDELDTS